MIDRDKVIKGLEHCARDRCIDCPYDPDCKMCSAFSILAEDALELLKDQEAKKVKIDMYGNFYCPWCSTDTTIEMGIMKLSIGTDYCPYCGNKVRWE